MTETRYEIRIKMSVTSEIAAAAFSIGIMRQRSAALYRLYPIIFGGMDMERQVFYDDHNGALRTADRKVVSINLK